MKEKLRNLPKIVNFFPQKLFQFITLEISKNGMFYNIDLKFLIGNIGSCSSREIRLEGHVSCSSREIMLDGRVSGASR